MSTPKERMSKPIWEYLGISCLSDLAIFIFLFFLRTSEDLGVKDSVSVTLRILGAMYDIDSRTSPWYKESEAICRLNAIRRFAVRVLIILNSLLWRQRLPFSAANTFLVNHNQASTHTIHCPPPHHLFPLCRTN